MLATVATLAVLPSLKSKLPYDPVKDFDPALSDLLGGYVTVMFASTASARPLVLTGKLRALGISTAKRSPAMPEVAPIAESGVPGFDTASRGGLVTIREGDLRDKLAAQGFVPQASTPQEFAAHIRSELVRFRKLVRVAGLPVE